MGWQPVDGGSSRFALTSGVNTVAADPIQSKLIYIYFSSILNDSLAQKVPSK